MIDILMATYNGEDFIREQVESIIQQSFQGWNLIVHDDGSCDKTMEILMEYACQDQRIRIIDDGIVHLGVAKNFMHLLAYSQAEYVMFCDQDDIWCADKVQMMYDAIKKRNNSVAQAVYSNAYLWNPERGVFSERNTLTYPDNLKKLLFLNTGIQGAAAMFNAVLRAIMLEPLDHYAMHDHVLILSALVYGEVTYIDRPLMYYRQHDNNVTGVAPGSMFKKMVWAYRNRHVPVVDENHYKGVRAFLNHHGTMMGFDERRTMAIFLRLPYDNYVKRFYVVIKEKFQLFNSVWLLVLKMLLRKFHNMTLKG